MSGVMRKALPTLLAVMLLFSQALAGPLVPATREQISEALACMYHCAFTAEYGTRSNVLLRWEEPIAIAVKGDVTEQDVAALDRFIEQLNRVVPGMPAVRRTDREDAGIVIWFCPLDEMKNRTMEYRPDNWGYAFYYFDQRGVIFGGEIAIASDMTSQRERTHLIQEELLCALGLTDDHYCRTDSILYQRWTDTQQLNAVDWLMLQMLYDPAVSPGMGVDEAMGILEQIY